MVKVTSMLEKLNLIEKVDNGSSKDTIIKGEDNNEAGKLIKKDNSTADTRSDNCKNDIEETKSVLKNESSKSHSSIDCNKGMLVNEIYSLYGLENSEINTVFMLDNLIKALPQDLPQEVIKQSIKNIINASKIDLDKLISDGEQRLKALEDLMGSYNIQTSNSIGEYKKEIDKFTKLINNAQEQIKIKEKILEEQNSIVKYETKKIESIINFFKK